VTIPAHARYVVIGAGMHGLSTAWHLARELEARGTGSGQDVVVGELLEAVQLELPADHVLGQ
jgi:glycine/D-amino acid oxidase-like deaminating enzyme